MANVFIGLIGCLFTFSIYYFSNSLIVVNRVITNLPTTLFEISVDLVNIDDDHIYFNQSKLINNVDNYISKYISKYIDNYTTKYIFINSEDDSICIDGKCDAVNIDFSASLSFNYQFKRSLTYEIWRKS